MTKRKETYYVADTETSFCNKQRDSRQVVLAGWQKVGNKRVNKHNTIRQFLDSLYNEARLFRQKKLVIFFHNLDYDASYFEDWLLRFGYRPQDIEEVRNLKTKELYKMSFEYRKVEIELRDSLKLYPASIEAIGKMLGYPKLVGTYDYDKIHQPRMSSFTKKEIKYFERDINILADLMDFHFKHHHKLKLSRSSYAFEELRNTVKSEDFKRRIPYETNIFDIDFKGNYMWLRKAYYGGFTYANPKYVMKRIGSGFVFDVNSLYPYVMTQDYPNYTSQLVMTHKDFQQLTPEILHDDDFFAVIEVKLNKLKLKPNHFPSLAKKMNYRGSEAVCDLNDLKKPFLTLTNIDLYWLYENYEVDVEFVQGYYYPKYFYRPFEYFVLKNAKIKEECGRKGDKLGRTLAKLTMNGSYGKFGQNVDFETAEPILGNRDMVCYQQAVSDDNEEQKPNNILIADFVTAKARNVLFTMIRLVNESPYFDFLYCDTDSVHIQNHTKMTSENLHEITKYIPSLRYDAERLGYWGLDNDFEYAKYLRSKAYYEMSSDGPIIKLAGVPKEGKEELQTKIEKHGLDVFTIPMKVKSRQKKRIKGGYDIVDGFKEIKPKGEVAKFRTG